MAKCCYICGVAGYEEILAMCIKCKSTFIHAYCMKVVEFIVPDVWVCEDCDESDETPQVVERHLASPEKPCKAVDISKKRVENSTKMDRLATLRPRGHSGSGHLPSAVSEPSFKQQSKVKGHVHARAAKTISKHVSTRVILHDSEHIKRYKTLKRRKLCNTPYFDKEMLSTLGLWEDIKWMAEQVGWAKFLTMKELTYISLTHEFLSTVKVKIPHGRCTEGRITFRLQNQDRQLTLENFNNIFGFCNEGDQTKPKEYHADEFWREITDEPQYNPRGARASSIYNPCFRVLQFFMAHTIFGRGRGGRRVVRTDELLHLWAMVHNHNLNTGKFLALHLQSVAKASLGDIVVGGLITSIARYFDINMDGLAQATGKNRIDLHTCQTMKMIVCHNGRYSLRFNKINSLWPLPDPANTTIQIPENWKRTFQRGMPHVQGDAPAVSSQESDSECEFEWDEDAPW